MTTEFTPGPWTADEDHKGTGEIRVHSAGVPRLVACVGNNEPDYARHVADARLIAAAPDLYEAMDMALMLLQVMSIPDIGGSLCGSARAVAEKARAALVKAGWDRADCGPSE